jgi:excisionase family DNA binding protein
MEAQKVPVSYDALLSKEQVATFFNVSVPTINNWIKNGTLKPIRIGRSVRFNREQLLGLNNNQIESAKINE